MTADDNFQFAAIPPPSTHEEQRLVDLVRAVVRDELRQHDDMIITAITDAVLRYSSMRGPRSTRSAA